MNWNRVMTATISSRKPISFAICYGFVSGPAHGRRLRQELEHAGFTVADIEVADIIIVHSGGCWLIPARSQPKLIIYVGMPLALDRPTLTLARAQRASFSPGKGHPLPNLKVRILNIYYLLRQGRRNFALVRQAKVAKLVEFPAAQTVFIANHYDPWPQSAALKDLISSKPWAFLGLQGTHDNIWEEPVVYAAIIEHYARLLA